MVQDNKWDVYVTPHALVVMAVLLLLIPLGWISAWVIAAAVHELFHCIAVLLCGKHIRGLLIGINGAKMQTEPLTYGQTALCAIAGPAGGFLLLPLAWKFPQLALCALVQSVFNLLPVYPLDGGRVIDALIKLIFNECVANRICSAVAAIVIMLLLLICTIAAVVLHTCLPLMIPLILLLQYRRK